MFPLPHFGIELADFKLSLLLVQESSQFEDVLVVNAFAADFIHRHIDLMFRTVSDLVQVHDVLLSFKQFLFEEFGLSLQFFHLLLRHSDAVVQDISLPVQSFNAVFQGNDSQLQDLGLLHRSRYFLGTNALVFELSDETFSLQQLLLEKLELLV
jgi:hypothetical protein